MAVATRSAISAPPPIPTADGIATFPILNCSIRKAEIPINAAGRNILFLNFSLCATLNSCVISLNVPTCNCFVTVISAKITSSPPVTAYGIVFPKMNITPRINQNKNVPTLAFSFFSPLIATLMLTSPQRI